MARTVSQDPNIVESDKAYKNKSAVLRKKTLMILNEIETLEIKIIEALNMNVLYDSVPYMNALSDTLIATDIIFKKDINGKSRISVLMDSINSFKKYAISIFGSSGSIDEKFFSNIKMSCSVNGVRKNSDYLHYCFENRSTITCLEMFETWKYLLLYEETRIQEDIVTIIGVTD